MEVERHLRRSSRARMTPKQAEAKKTEALRNLLHRAEAASKAKKSERKYTSKAIRNMMSALENISVANASRGPVSGYVPAGKSVTFVSESAAVKPSNIPFMLSKGALASLVEKEEESDKLAASLAASMAGLGFKGGARKTKKQRRSRNKSKARRFH
jgi:predicted transcriptional regulator